MGIGESWRVYTGCQSTGKPISDRGLRVRCESLIPDAHPRPFCRPKVDLSGLEPDPKMDSFELNKILGAVLGTCLVLLVTSFTAGAIFAPVHAGKAGFRDRREGRRAEPAARKPRPRRPSRSRSCCRPPRSRRAPPRPRNAPPATPSRRAAPTGSVRISTASSATTRARAAASISRPP